MKCVRVLEPTEFDAKVNDALAQSESVFVLFFGREAPETNESWCPDCVIADPTVRKVVNTVPNSILLEVPVDRKTEVASPTNIFRTREDIKLGPIPTLLKWTKAGPGNRLVEEECFEEANIAKFVNSA
ncbi:hypothetical protein FBU59_002459 [Linderina macrospora]|uniref:Uncharacterized protein n=1 Tax=Linderina macrospora TaxID=4868 RepID=A0ACC1JB53_9FUNG|nr:hypothetical protein FBU59_002459 [Linderina macrospora]